MKYEKLKGSSGFCFSWFLLCAYTSVNIAIGIVKYDASLFSNGLLSLIILVMSGYLGCDMINDICKKCSSKKGKGKQ